MHLQFAKRLLRNASLRRISAGRSRIVDRTQGLIERVKEISFVCVQQANSNLKVAMFLVENPYVS